MKHTHERCQALPFLWPDPPFQVVLVEPEIPQNTGTIARLCAATGTPLHLVGPLGFSLTSSHLRRAGLDYWESVKLTRYSHWEEFIKKESGVRSQESEAGSQESKSWYFSTRGTIPYTAARFKPGDQLIFGSESRGLSDEVLAGHESRTLAVPMQVEHVRSLNLAMTVGIVLYEALRQLQDEYDLPRRGGG